MAYRATHQPCMEFGLELTKIRMENDMISPPESLKGRHTAQAPNHHTLRVRNVRRWRSNSGKAAFMWKTTKPWEENPSAGRGALTTRSARPSARSPSSQALAQLPGSTGWAHAGRAGLEGEGQGDGEGDGDGERSRGRTRHPPALSEAALRGARPRPRPTRTRTDARPRRSGRARTAQAPSLAPGL